MNAIMLDTIRECFEGVIPAVLGTADLAGMPNASYLSQVQYMDRDHVALSYQFFNKTRANILANPHARLTVVNPYTGAQYSLALQYLRTETSGQLFESMKAKLAGLASHTGMTGVFKLLGSDVFRVKRDHLRGWRCSAAATAGAQYAGGAAPVLRAPTGLPRPGATVR